MRGIFLAHLVVVLAAGAWAAEGSAKKSPAKRVKKTEQAVTKVDGTVRAASQRLAVGESFTIRLPGNPTTGYEWVLKSIDRTVAEPVGEVEYKRDDAKPGMVGVGGNFSLSIRGLKPGKTTAVLEYKRSWEKAEPAKTYRAEITVLPKK